MIKIKIKKKKNKKKIKGCRESGESELVGENGNIFVVWKGGGEDVDLIGGGFLG